MAKKTGKSKKNVKKIAIGGGALAQLVIFLGALFISVIVFSYIAQGKLEEERLRLESEKAIIKGTADEIRAKIAMIPNLDNDIRSLISQLEGDFKMYYGNAPQERLIYALDEFIASSGVEVRSLSFAKESITDKVTSQKEFQDSYNETKTPAQSAETETPAADAPPVAPEPVKFSMDVQAYNITVGMASTYKDLLKFLDLVAKSEKTISVIGVSLDQNAHAVTLNEDGIPASYLDPLFAEEGYRFPTAATGETEYEIIVNNNRDVVTASVNLLAFLVPSIDEYITPEDIFASASSEIYSWEFKQPAVNPFSVLELLDSMHKKQKIYDFNKGNYPQLSVLNANPDPAKIIFDFSSRPEATITYLFDETAANPQITLNLNAENIIFEEGTDRFGMEIYSAQVNDAMLYATFTDANNQRHNVRLASAITWKDYSLIDAKLPAAPFPIKLSYISIVQTGAGSELENGLLSFKNIYAEKRETPSYRDFLNQNQQQQQQTEEPSQEETPQGETPPQNENPPEVTF
jgi:hypothetical protein